MAIKTIIFGATGGVGNYALHYAVSKGAHVSLAMRDTSKTVPGLTSEQESTSCTRITADLTDPASVSVAAKQSGAESAFIYLIHGPQGTPRASIQALKDAGVKHVVFLSSITVDDPIREVKKEDHISYVHAQVEIDLEAIYGEGNFTALRPGYFASNTLRYAGQMKSGIVREHYPSNKYDFIAPQDIGEVAGAMLLKEGSLPRVVELAGPQTISLTEVLENIAKANGKALEVQHISEAQAVENMTKYAHMPQPIAAYLARVAGQVHDGTDKKYKAENLKQAQENVQTTLGRDGISIKQWIEENKAAFYSS